MTDLIGPAPAAETVRALACRHGVAYEPTPLDAFAADVSRLSDAEVPGDQGKRTRPLTLGAAWP